MNKNTDKVLNLNIMKKNYDMHYYKKRSKYPYSFNM